MTDAVPQTAAVVVSALAELADPARAASSQGFFKTAPGQYGAGDVFLGVTVPAQRRVAKLVPSLPLAELEVLLDSEVHEHRLTGLIIAGNRFERASRTGSRDETRRAELADWYLAAVHRGRVNNWDLVDSSAAVILGGWLFDRSRDVLFELAGSPVLWERRVAIIATQGFINRGDASTTLELSPLLLGDTEDLMHKAVGWMLREVGKRVDRELLIGFLDEYAGRMPRKALSYATEHLAPEQRAHYRAVPRTHAR
ncbi:MULTISPECIES: DNA alkylation repair protein [unclassified Leifsonia]|uniref:DNA alkylation repair protein n=1 Tax=unclassified Leifsonia TaxID=2663824 RepID=UPI0006F8C4E7|nr:MULTISPECIES: DNA alkylation repair protein [unclassified Leifsonia]KQX05006.1 DNA alkylation repair protein [Leifsonia sp. Root1293]KRA08638.1 DNA alkylation repair protein [Leifsonia sp. Root60]